MTRETYIKLKPILDAWAEGKTIQYRRINRTDWLDLKGTEINIEYTNNQGCEFRIKPEPREFWVNVYKPALGEDGPIDNITIYPTKTEADRGAHSSRLECIKVKEVLD